MQNCNDIIHKFKVTSDNTSLRRRLKFCKEQIQYGKGGEKHKISANFPRRVLIYRGIKTKLDLTVAK